jgi:hypothetical protein
MVGSALSSGETRTRPRASGGVNKGRATYVYCLIVASKRPRLTQVPAGPPGTGPVRLLDVGPQRYLAVADAPLSRYGEAAIRSGFADLAWVSRAAVAHESVVEAFIGATAVLPMKLFTLFTSDERALAHMRQDQRRIEGLVKRLADHLEWGVRVVLNPAGRDGKEKASGAVARSRPGRSGIAYLNEKRAQRDAARKRAGRAHAAAAAVYRKLSGRSRAAKMRAAGELPAQHGPLLLDAAFLVPRAESRAFSAVVRREQRELGRHGYGLTLTGPWPPYSFVQT